MDKKELWDHFMMISAWHHHGLLKEPCKKCQAIGAILESLSDQPDGPQMTERKFEWLSEEERAEILRLLESWYEAHLRWPMDLAESYTRDELSAWAKKHSGAHDQIRALLSQPPPEPPSVSRDRIDEILGLSHDLGAEQFARRWKIRDDLLEYLAAEGISVREEPR